MLPDLKHLVATLILCLLPTSNGGTCLGLWTGKFLLTIKRLLGNLAATIAMAGSFGGSGTMEHQVSRELLLWLIQHRIKGPWVEALA